MGNEVQAILTEAVSEFATYGYTDAHQLDYWLGELRAAIEGIKQKPAHQIASDALMAQFKRAVRPGSAAKYHRDIPTFGIEKVDPQLRPILQARILVSADLIKLNRAQAYEITMRRFAGWASSQPVGGGPVDKRDVKMRIGRALQDSDFVARRMLIDQGAKLTAAVHKTIADGNGAIAVVWHSQWRQPGYNYRPDHKERDGKIYLLRNSWAHEQGLVKPGANGYYDDITHVAQEVFCQCSAIFLYSLKKLPSDMLTAKGRNRIGETSAINK